MKTKATRRRMISCFAQIINGYVLGYKISELVRNEKIKTRKFSYDSQMYLLMLGQFLHVFSLNELADISNIYAKELSRIRGIDPANHSTFSNANRTRNPEVMETTKRVGPFCICFTVYVVFMPGQPSPCAEACSAATATWASWAMSARCSPAPSADLSRP